MIGNMTKTTSDNTNAPIEPTLSGDNESKQSVASKSQAGNSTENSEKGSDSNRESGFKVFDRRFWASEKDEDDSGADKSSAPSYVESLENKLKEKEQQLQDYIAAYKKEVVEGLEATKGRLEKESKQKEAALKSSMAEPMIDILEAVERSLLLAGDAPSAENLISGFELVKKLIEQKLSQFGLERISSSGSVFDPEFHEAIATVPATDIQPSNTVVAEISPGFVLKGKVIRPAKVQVAK